MGIIQDIESIKYRFVLDLINSEEAYNKKRNVITGIDVLNICLERYRFLQQILLPLKTKLGNSVEVTDINFINGEQEDNGIIVKYIKNDHPYVLGISNIDYEDINVVATDLRLQNDAFVEANRDIILNTFRNIDENDLSDDIVLKSTTGKFSIRDNCDFVKISDHESKVFAIESKHFIYAEKGNISIPKITCNFPKLKEMLENSDNIQLIYNHIHVYEEYVPKKLIKKLT